MNTKRPCDWAASASITWSAISMAGFTALRPDRNCRCPRSVSARRSRPSASPRHMRGRRSWSMYGHRVNASRNASPGAWAFRSTISANGCRSCRPIARSSSTVRAAIARRSPRACCSVTDSRRSAKSPAALPPGTQASCLWKPRSERTSRSPSCLCSSCVISIRPTAVRLRTRSSVPAFSTT